MAWKSNKQQGTIHSDSCTMAFGKPSKHDDCPRCQELKAGSAPRKAWNHRQLKWDQMRREAMAEHFKPGGKHDQIIKAGGIDTAFDW